MKPAALYCAENLLRWILFTFNLHDFNQRSDDPVVDYGGCRIAPSDLQLSTSCGLVSNGSRT